MCRLLLIAIAIPLTWIATVACVDAPTGPQSARNWAGCDSAWTTVKGDTTWYRHTVCATRTTVDTTVARVDTTWQYDTTMVVVRSTVTDSMKVASPAPGGATLAAGLSLPAAWKGNYCTWGQDGTIQQIDPRVLLARVQLFARCDKRLFFTPPRRLLTRDGTASGLFDVAAAKRATDAIAAVLPPDTLRKYAGTILGLNLGDDYPCAKCWGGTPITQAQIAAWAAYTRGKLPGVNLGVRVTPDWVQKYPTLAPMIDYAWAQWHTKKAATQADYYGASARIAGQLGLSMVYGLNAEDCYGQPNTPACTASDLTTFGTFAITYPGNCAFMAWQYTDSTWSRADIRQAWAGLVAKAATVPARSCRRAA